MKNISNITSFCRVPIAGGSTPPPPVPRTNLIAEFLLASNADDTSDTANNGTVNFGTFIGGGVNLLLDASNVQIPTNSVYNTTTGCISMRVQTLKSGIAYLLCRNNNVQDAIFFSISDPADSSNPGMPTFYNWSGGTFDSCTTAVNDGSWHNIIVNYTPTNTDIYIDNVLDYSGASQFNNGTDGAPLWLGYRDYDVSGHAFEGNIGLFRWYSTVQDSTNRGLLFGEGHP